MRPEPKLTPGAKADVRQAVVYYNTQRFHLGLDFLEQFETALVSIREAPLLSTLVDAPIRRLLMARFPFGIFYVAGSTEEPDVILAVVDLRQDPAVIRKAYQR
jgi:hypothetical protein